MWQNYKVTSSGLTPSIIPFIRDAITRSYLDSNFESNILEMETIYIVKNEFWEDQYRLKKSELESRACVSEDVLFSYSRDLDVVPAVLLNGLCASRVNSCDEIYGVRLFQHADILLNSAQFYYTDNPNTKMALFLCLTARSKVVSGLPTNASTFPKDTDCCISGVRPCLTESVFTQLDSSQVYIFDQDDSIPASFRLRPRQFIPIACVMYRRKQLQSPCSISVNHFQCYASLQQNDASSHSNTTDLLLSSTEVMPTPEPALYNEKEDEDLTARFIFQFSNVASRPLAVIPVDAGSMHPVSVTVTANQPSLGSLSSSASHSGINSVSTKWPELASLLGNQQSLADLGGQLLCQIPPSVHMVRTPLGHAASEPCGLFNSFVGERPPRPSQQLADHGQPSHPWLSTSLQPHAPGCVPNTHTQAVPPGNFAYQQPSYHQNMFHDHAPTVSFPGRQISRFEPPVFSAPVREATVHHRPPGYNETVWRQTRVRGLVTPQHTAEAIPDIHRQQFSSGSIPYDQCYYPQNMNPGAAFPEQPVYRPQPPFFSASTMNGYSSVPPELHGYNGAGPRQTLGFWSENPVQTFPLSHISPQLGTSFAALPHCTSLPIFNTTEPLRKAHCPSSKSVTVPRQSTQCSSSASVTVPRRLAKTSKSGSVTVTRQSAQSAQFSSSVPATVPRQSAQCSSSVPATVPRQSAQCSSSVPATVPRQSAQCSSSASTAAPMRSAKRSSSASVTVPRCSGQPAQRTVCLLSGGAHTTSSNSTSTVVPRSVASMSPAVDYPNAVISSGDNPGSGLPLPDVKMELQVDRTNREVVLFDVDQSDVPLQRGNITENHVENDSLSWMRLDAALANLLICCEQQVSNVVPVMQPAASEMNTPMRAVNGTNSTEISVVTGEVVESLVKQEQCEVEIDSEAGENTEAGANGTVVGDSNDRVSNSLPIVSVGQMPAANYVPMPTNNVSNAMITSADVVSFLPLASMDALSTRSMQESRFSLNIAKLVSGLQSEAIKKRVWLLNKKPEAKEMAVGKWNQGQLI